MQACAYKKDQMKQIYRFEGEKQSKNLKQASFIHCIYI